MSENLRPVLLRIADALEAIARHQVPDFKTRDELRKEAAREQPPTKAPAKTERRVTRSRYLGR